MAVTRFRHVAPGDLITAELFNDLIDWLNALGYAIDGHGSGTGAGRLGLRPTPGPAPVAGGTYAFDLELDGNALAGPEDFDLNAVFANVVGGNRGDWEAAPLRVVGFAGAESPLGVIRVGPGPPVTLRIALTVPLAATSVDMAMRATSHTRASSNNLSASLRIDVGRAGGGVLLPAITRILPLGGVPAGDAITIEGVNFAAARVDNVVVLDAAGANPRPLTLSIGTTTSLLTSVPADLAGVPRTVPVTLRTPVGTAQGSIAVSARGRALLSDVTGDDLTLVFGEGRHERRLQLDGSQLGAADAFTIGVTFRDTATGNVNTRWSAGFANPVDSVAHVDPHSQQYATFSLLIDVPDDPADVVMRVTAEAAAAPASSASLDITIPIERPLGGPLTVARQLGADIQREMFDGFPAGGLAIRLGTFPTATLVALFEDDGDYLFTAPPQAPKGHWTIEDMPSQQGIVAYRYTPVQIQLVFVPGSSPEVGPVEYLYVVASRVVSAGGVPREYDLRIPIRALRS